MSCTDMCPNLGFKNISDWVKMVPTGDNWAQFRLVGGPLAMFYLGISYHQNPDHSAQGGRAEEYFVKSKKVSAIGGQVAQTLAGWTSGILRDS